MSKLSEERDDEKLYLSNYKKAEEKLKPLLTHEFLSTLTLAVRTIGWDVDHVESESLVRIIFDIANEQTGCLEPFDFDD